MIHLVLHSHLSKQKILLKKFLIFLKQVHQADVVEVVRDYATLLVLVDVKDALHVVEIVGHHVPINAPIHVDKIVLDVVDVVVDVTDVIQDVVVDAKHHVLDAGLLVEHLVLGVPEDVVVDVVDVTVDVLEDVEPDALIVEVVLEVVAVAALLALDVLDVLDVEVDVWPLV